MVKAQTFVYFERYNFVQISLVCGPNTCQIMHGETRPTMSALLTVAQKSYNVKFITTKTDFSDILCTIADADFERLKSLITFIAVS